MTFDDLARAAGNPVVSVDRPIVCVQGLGFVGAAMAVATASARRPDGSPAFRVVGVDLETPVGKERVAALNQGRFPVSSLDTRLQEELEKARKIGNLVATTEPAAYGLADVTVVDIPLDVELDSNGEPAVDLSGLREACRTLGAHMAPGSLVVVETTVPPGTCAEVVVPELAAALAARGLDDDAILVAHSYERVMPGPEYLDSIVNYWRVYAGHTEEAADACESFLSQVVNVVEYPLTRLAGTTASETAKVLENSYRAVNIAFMEEWGRFAEAAGVDMFEIVEAIRLRPTHSNIRQPGYGVGGYCLTKDPYLGLVAAKDVLGVPNHEFPFSTSAVVINDRMPLVSLDQIQTLLGGDLAGRRVLLIGVSYRGDVADTRNSPSELFVREAEQRGATVTATDPLVHYWAELDRNVPAELPSPAGYDAVVFAVPHAAYRDLDVGDWLADARPLVFDANNVLGQAKLAALRARGFQVGAIGRGNQP